MIRGAPRLQTAHSDRTNSSLPASPGGNGGADAQVAKGINDRFGYPSGDAVLRHVSDTCSGLLRESDLMGRIGGEEFAILLPQTPIEQAGQIAGRLCMAVANGRQHAADGRPFSVTVSIGVATATAAMAGCAIDSIISQADSALYHAKAAGRNGWRSCR